VLVVLPPLIFLIVVVGAFGASTPVLIVIIGVVFAPGIARIIRAAVLAEMGKKYVTTAKVQGESAVRIMARELMPNVLPTGLDSRVETEIMALIDGLRAGLGFASILISHNLPFIAAHCQRTGVLENGELVEEGAAADVLLAPRHPYTRSLIAARPDINAVRPARPGAETRAGAADGPLVTVEHLTKRYQQRFALRDVSFTIGRAEVLGLVGESGSGKTTLGLSLAGLTSHEGSITFHVADRRQQRTRPTRAATPGPRNSSRSSHACGRAGMPTRSSPTRRRASGPRRT